jgi:hypothetical protein
MIACMAPAARYLSIVLLLSIGSAHLGASVCLIDCKGRAASPVKHQPAACHEAGSSDAAAAQLSPLSTGCHADHTALTAELRSLLDLRVTRLVMLTVEVASASTSVTPSAPFVSLPSYKDSPAPTGAILPLRL